MSKIYTNPIKARFIIASPNFFIKSVARTITSILQAFLKKLKHAMANVDFLQAFTLFGTINQCNKPVLDIMK